MADSRDQIKENHTVPAVLSGARLIYIISVLALCFAGITSCASTPSAPTSFIIDSSSAMFADADKLVVVDCLLPGMIQQLGGIQYVTPRRPIKAAAGVCEIKGGEYTAFDRANYATALKVWLKDANAGDAKAQTHVGEIYEQGLGIAPDYQQALKWYRKAADQGYTQAQANLGYLYEKGLGVSQDRKQALDWYRKASGLHDQLVYASEVTSVNYEAGKKIQALSQQLLAQTQEAQSLRGELEQMHTRLNDKKSDLDALRIELEKNRRAYEMLRTQPQSSTSPPAELERLKQNIQQRELELQQAQQQVAQLQQDAQVSQSNFSTKLQQAEQRDANLRLELEAQQQQFGMLSEQLGKSELERVKTQQALNKQQLNLASQKVLFDEQKSMLMEQQRAFELRQQQLGQQTDGEITRLKDELDSSKHALNQRQSVITRLEKKIAQFETQVTSLQAAAADQAPRVTFVEIARKKVSFGTYHALIIGNQNYQTLSDLAPVVESDAQALEQLLKKQYGYKTNLLINANRAQIYQQLQLYQNQLSKKDNLLIYYAGRGKLSADGIQGYWLPVDADGTNSSGHWISNQEIANQLKVMRAKHVLVVSDASYTDSMTNPPPQVDVTTDMSTDAQIQRLTSLARFKVRTVLSSGGEQPQSDHTNSAHSMFAGSLLEILKNNQSILEGQALASQISSKLKKNIDQVPGYYGVRDAGHLFGDYLFVPVI